jgi:cytochrome c peroxidase
MMRLALLALLLPVSAGAVDFDAEERAKIASLGPWPPAIERDPSNRLSGRAEAIAFGATLFDETRFSANGEISCRSCHDPTKGWSDGKPVSMGLQRVDRNAPGLMNVRLHRWFGWDGASDSLWSSSLRPILDAREIGGSVARTAEVIRSDAALSRCFAKATGSEPAAMEDEAAFVAAAKALAAFQETLVSPRTPFDEFRDALLRGKKSDYPEAAQRGLKTFIGSGNCVMCHAGPAFTNGEFHDTGLPFFMASGRPDPGRYDGIKRVKASPFNLLSQHNDDPGQAGAFAVRHVDLQHRNWGEFKTPSLRNLAQTAPYMHDGSMAGLRDVIRHYSDLDIDRLHADGEAILRPLRLSEAEIADLVAFLLSLSAPAAATQSAVQKCGTN